MAAVAPVIAPPRPQRSCWRQPEWEYESNCSGHVLRRIRLLREAAAVPWSAEDGQWSLLARLWALFFPHAAFIKEGEEWKRLGFQRQDPTSDLRGAGELAIAHMIYFAEAEEGRSEALLAEPPDCGWAVVCITVTHFLKFYFELQPREQRRPPQPLYKAGGSRARAALATLLSNERDALKLVFTQCVQFVLQRWAAMQREMEEVTLLQFHLAWQALRKAVDAVFVRSKRPPATHAGLQAAFLKQLSKQAKKAW
eukprot:PLAT10898.1.p1 GENE.PLAT10898.1~~PLAT10898.1.p1  ORF type:complete len:273 (+),score=67.87 PLAT10898.1:61-819(+)